MSAESPPGQSFDGGRYLVLQELGRGGMGIVYACQDTQLSRKVALKCLASDLRASEAAMDIFMQEGQALAALDHPNLVRIFDVRKEMQGSEPIAYLVMEYVEGTTLEKMLYDPGGTAGSLLQSLGGALHLMAQVADALHYCHGRGIIHRDIKPANVLVQADGLVKLVDFGLARSLDMLMQRATRVRGTPAYMAPEQIVGEALGPATDIYALGVSLYEVLCRRTPFIEGELTYHQVYSTPAPPRVHVPDLPEELDQLVMRCLAKDPAQRPQSAEEVASLLRTYVPPPVRMTAPSQRAGSRPYPAVSGFLPAARSGLSQAVSSEPGPVSDIGVVPPRPRSVPRYLALLGLVVAIAVAVVGVGLLRRAPAGSVVQKKPEGQDKEPAPPPTADKVQAAGEKETLSQSAPSSRPATAPGDRQRRSSHRGRGQVAQRSNAPVSSVAVPAGQKEAPEHPAAEPAPKTLSVPPAHAPAPTVPGTPRPPAAQPAAPVKTVTQPATRPAQPKAKSQPEAPLTF